MICASWHRLLACWRPSEDGYTVVIRDGRGQQHFTGTLCRLNDGWLILRYVKKIYPQTIPPYTSITSGNHWQTPATAAAVAHQLWGVVCSAFRHALLYTLLVTSYISSEQSGHSPLMSGISKSFSPRELPLTGYVLIFGPFSVNPGEAEWEDPNRSTVKYSDQPVSHQQSHS